jgi:hypothetical protein
MASASCLQAAKLRTVQINGREVTLHLKSLWCTRLMLGQGERGPRDPQGAGWTTRDESRDA